MRAIALALVAATAAGCIHGDEEDAAHVVGLRVLGVQSEPPEVTAPGQTVALTAWAVDTLGRAIDVTWSACLLPYDGHVDPACVYGTSGKVALGSGASLTVTLPDYDADQFGAPDALGGVYLPIVAHATAGGDVVDAVYRLRVRGGRPVNTNPVLETIDGLPPDGIPQPLYKGEILALHAHFANDSYEMYQVPSDDGLVHFVQETLTTQWFSTYGVFGAQTSGGDQLEGFRVDGNLPPPGVVFDVWAVGHDERGGTTMLHRNMILQ
jgi:hypothetical protein